MRFLTRAPSLAIVVLLGAGASPAPLRFAPAPGSPVPIGGRPNGVAAADVNGDGKPDLVVTNGGTSGVSILLGDGRGGFRAAPGSPLAVSAPPHLAAAGDLDRDGRPDLVATSHDSHGVFVWLNEGDGRFRAAPGSPFSALVRGKPHNHGLALGDLDGDGDLDVATTDDEAHVVAVLLGDGKGRLQPAPESPFGVGREPYPLALGDVSGDGHPDAVTPDVGSASLSVLLGDGKGGFSPAKTSPIAVTSRPYFVALGDLDGNGTLDAVTTHDDVTLATALLGDGHGGLRPAAGSPFDVGRRSWKIVLVDMDADGKQDLVLGGGDAVVVMRGDGRGGFAPGSTVSAGRGAWSVTVADFDADGRADVAAAALEAGAVSVLLQR